MLLPEETRECTFLSIELMVYYILLSAHHLQVHTLSSYVGQKPLFHLWH